MALTKIDDRGLNTPIDLLDNEKIRLGTGNDLELYHNGSHSILDNNTGNLYAYTAGFVVNNAANTEHILRGFEDGACELYYNHSKKFHTRSDGTQTTGIAYADAFHVNDDEHITLGDSNDLDIYHNSSNSWNYIKGVANNLAIQAKSGENSITAYSDGKTSLFYDGTEKLETTSTGALVTGKFCIGAADRNIDWHHPLQVEGTSAETSSISICRNSNDVNPPYLTFCKTRGTAVGGTTVVADNDLIANIQFKAADGDAGESTAAQITAEIDGTPGSSDTPGRLVFKTTADGSGSSTSRMTIDSSGKVGIGITTPDQLLHVRKGDAGGVDSASSSVITIENSDHATLQFLTPNDKNQQIRFGDVQDTGSGWIEYSHSTNALVIGTNGPEKFRIDSSGRVGIGEASPSTLLNLKGTAGGGATGVKIVNTADEYSALIMDANRSGAGSALGIIEGRWNGNSNCAIYLTSGDDTTNKDDASIRFFTRGSGASITQRVAITTEGWFKAKGDYSSYLNAGNYHEFQSNNASNVLMNMKHHNAAGYGLIMKFEHAGTQMYALRIYDEANGNDRAYIRTDGDFESANNSYGAISDVKLKENIVDAKSQWDDIKALRIRNFNFKSDSSKKKMLGLVAQEAESVCPSLVKTQTDFKGDTGDAGTTTKVLKYSILYMKAIKALQEAITKIETLETKVAALEAA